jgi:signal transduction histidine kinase
MLNSYQVKYYLKVSLLILAIGIAFFTLWYTNELVNQLAQEEEQKIKTWANATRLLASPEYEGDVDFLLNVVQQNNTIPVILTDQDGQVTAYRNLDSTKQWNDRAFAETIALMKEHNEPIEIEFLKGQKLIIYYENSFILDKLLYFPFVQLAAIAIFLLLSYASFNYSRRSEQNRVWVGMSKETAHQLGTPISSLMAWVDLLEESPDSLNAEIISELRQDMGRLNMITERFSKIGSKPELKSYDMRECLMETVQYLQKRTSSKVNFDYSNCQENIKASINRPLLAWVIENLSKNAIDAMKGEGEIRYEMYKSGNKLLLDISDTGSGIPKNRWKTIFKPGFTTKRRGWGLGLALVKRIIVDYHQGKIFVKDSQMGIGTTFRIILKSD